MTFAATLKQMNHATRPDAAPVALRILATTDLHAHLYPFNYYTDRADGEHGLANLVGLIEDARAEQPNTLLLDNGDTLHGDPMGDAARVEIMPRDHPHPIIAAMNTLGFDAMTPGNHDFDLGLAHLEASLAAAEFPIVSANVSTLENDPDGDVPLYPRHVILTREMRDRDGVPQTLRIGITGALPPQTLHWCNTHLGGRLRIDDIVTRVAAEVAAMRRAGVDLVIVLAHSGLGPRDPGPMAENVAAALARLPGVDALVAGHTHRTFPGRILTNMPGDPQGRLTGTPVVQPGFWGSHLGVIDLELTPNSPPTPRHSPLTGGDTPAQAPQSDTDTDTDADTGTLGWTVTASQAHLLRAARHRLADQRPLLNYLRARPALRDTVRRDHRLIRDYAAQPLGQTSVPLETYFSLIAPCAATQIVADAKRAALDTMIDTNALPGDTPVLMSVAPFKSGGRAGPGYYTDIPAGPLLLRHAAALYIYPNGLALTPMTGAAIRDWLEGSVSIFNTITPRPGADPQPLINPDYPSYNFDRMVGLHYEVDVTRPPRIAADGAVLHPDAGRVRNLRLADGTPLADDRICFVLTNTYRSSGGGPAPEPDTEPSGLTMLGPVREALVSYITQSPVALAPAPDRNWIFAPLGGVAVTFRTGPGALGHADRAAALGLTPAGPCADGFVGYILHL